MHRRSRAAGPGAPRRGRRRRSARAPRFRNRRCKWLAAPACAPSPTRARAAAGRRAAAAPWAATSACAFPVRRREWRFAATIASGANYRILRGAPASRAATATRVALDVRYMRKWRAYRPLCSRDGEADRLRGPPHRDTRAHMTVIAVFNQKGGVGKTTTALNLLAGLAQMKHRPLAIDLDPQAHLSGIFGVRPRLADDSVYSFFMRQRPLADVTEIAASGVMVCPGHLDLSKLDTMLGKGVNVVTRLRMALRAPGIAPGPVVIDCCPLLGVLSLNAIFACDVVVVPVSADYLALQGAQQVERALNALEPVFKSRLPRRYVLTRYDGRRNMSSEVAELMAMAFRPEEICHTRIAENVSLAESPARQLDVFRYAPASAGARDYKALVEELVAAGFA